MIIELINKNIIQTMKKLILFILPTILLTLSGCKDNDGIYLFSLEDDKALGAETAAQIAADPATYPVLDRNSNQAAYAYLEEMRDIILAGGEVTHKDDFDWELYIIDDDATLNAFCTPGGYIYIYTGLIQYLDDASSLAGVMGHEIGHADKRHSVSQLQKSAAISLLTSAFINEESGALVQLGATMVSNLTTLAFSRADETEADDASVAYLCPTNFEADGAANFFIKIDAEGGSSTPQFLSTHPNPDNRVENLQEKATAISCGTEESDPMINGISYQTFQSYF